MAFRGSYTAIARAMRAAAMCSERADLLKTLAVATHGMKKVRECCALARQLEGRVDIDFVRYFHEFKEIAAFFDDAVEAARKEASPSADDFAVFGALCKAPASA